MNEIKPEYEHFTDVHGRRGVLFKNAHEMLDRRIFGWDNVFTHNGVKYVTLDEADERLKAVGVTE